MHIRLSRLLPVFIILLVAGCSGSDNQGPYQQTERLLQDSLDASVATIGVPGATMTVVGPDGANWVCVNGLSNRENSIAMTPGLKFRIGSVTKTFTATVILQLVQEGWLKLNDTLDSFLPGLVPNGARITIRQLLNHTSGIFDYAQAQNPNFLQALYDNPLRKWTREELVAIANANGPYFSPGTGFHYSNTNYVLLGMIIEQRTGSTYAQEVRSRIFVPLGLQNTSIPDTPDMPEGSTRGYTYDSTKAVNERWVNTTRFDPSWAFGTGSVISNSEDMLIWIEALMTGALLDAQRKTDMFTFVSIGIPGFEYGLGLERQNWEAIGHTGDFVYGGQAAMYQYRGWKFIVLVNASPSNESVGFGSEYIMFKAIAALGLLTP
jgi:D-alanyl-D-alanine carboxypeptidase